MTEMELLRAIGGLDDELVEFAAPGEQEMGQNPKKPLHRWQWALPAACLLLAALSLHLWLSGAGLGRGFGGGQMAGGWQEGGGPEAPSGEIPSGALQRGEGLFLDEIRGLRVEDDNPSGEAESAGAARVRIDELHTLLRVIGAESPGTEAAVTIVKVVSVKETSGDGGVQGQIAECEIAFDVLGDAIEGAIELSQSRYGGCAGEEQSNLLRKGGAYLLPLVRGQGEERWRIFGDLDVLFEVDDQGLVHSHSRHPGLNKYDGQELAYLWKDVGYLYMNPILRSSLAELLSQGYEVERKGQTLRLVHPNLGWDEADAETFSATIGADGKIAPREGEHNVFGQLKGMTEGEMDEALLKIERYLRGEPRGARSQPTETQAPLDASEAAQASEAPSLRAEGARALPEA
ncbi:MAG: hypothetical protein LBU47_03175 [Christensenellaceae bacterium]|jgi:hypothetical protein|nr:hypothetical protein [Christensenellaceae bacterium]